MIDEVIGGHYSIQSRFRENDNKLGEDDLHTRLQDLGARIVLIDPRNPTELRETQTHRDSLQHRQSKRLRITTSRQIQITSMCHPQPPRVVVLADDIGFKSPG